MFKLTWEDQTLELDPGEYILGRSSRCDIQIIHDSVSRQHAKLIVEESGAYIEDLGSSNGTYINGKLITARTPLADGDRIHLGKALLEVSLPIEEAATVIFSKEGETVTPPASPFDEKTVGLDDSPVTPPEPPAYEPTEVAIPTRETPSSAQPAQPPPPPPPPPPVQQPPPPPRMEQPPAQPAQAPSPPPPVRQDVQTIPPLQAELADIGPRLVGWIIDLCLMFFVPLPLIFVSLLVASQSDALGLLLSLLSYGVMFLIGIANLVYGPAVKGKSLGMHFMKLRLVTEDMKTPIGWGPAIIRWLVQGFCSWLFFIGYIWALFDERNQTLHDKVAKTLVVKESR